MSWISLRKALVLNPLTLEIAQLSDPICIISELKQSLENEKIIDILTSVDQEIFQLLANKIFKDVLNINQNPQALYEEIKNEKDIQKKKQTINQFFKDNYCVSPNEQEKMIKNLEQPITKKKLENLMYFIGDQYKISISNVDINKFYQQHCPLIFEKYFKSDNYQDEDIYMQNLQYLIFSDLDDLLLQEQNNQEQQISIQRQPKDEQQFQIIGKIENLSKVEEENRKKKRSFKEKKLAKRIKKWAKTKSEDINQIKVYQENLQQILVEEQQQENKIIEKISKQKQDMDEESQQQSIDLEQIQINRDCKEKQRQKELYEQYCLQLEQQKRQYQNLLKQHDQKSQSQLFSQIQQKRKKYSKQNVQIIKTLFQPDEFHATLSSVQQNIEKQQSNCLLLVKEILQIMDEKLLNTYIYYLVDLCLFTLKYQNKKWLTLYSNIYKYKSVEKLEPQEQEIIRISLLKIYNCLSTLTTHLSVKREFTVLPFQLHASGGYSSTVTLQIKSDNQSQPLLFCQEFIAGAKQVAFIYGEAFCIKTIFKQFIGRDHHDMSTSDLISLLYDTSNLNFRKQFQRSLQDMMNNFIQKKK